MFKFLSAECAALLYQSSKTFFRPFFTQTEEYHFIASCRAT